MSITVGKWTAHQVRSVRVIGRPTILQTRLQTHFRNDYDVNIMLAVLHWPIIHMTIDY